MTRAKLVPLFEDMKEFVKSMVKGSEIALRRDLGGRIGSVEKELHQTQHALRATKVDLQGEIQATREDLQGQIQANREEMGSMEGRLSDKIDSIHTRVDDHESRITTLETPHT